MRMYKDTELDMGVHRGGWKPLCNVYGSRIWVCRNIWGAKSCNRESNGKTIKHQMETVIILMFIGIGVSQD